MKSVSTTRSWERATAHRVFEQMLGAVSKHHGELATNDKKRRTPNDTWAQRASQITLWATGLDVTLTVGTAFFLRFMTGAPAWIPAGLMVVELVLLGIMLAGALTMLGYALFIYWRALKRPMQQLLPAVFAQMPLDHALITELASIGGVEELSVAHNALVEEADAMERHRSAWFATIGLLSAVAVGTGIWKLAAGEQRPLEHSHAVEDRDRREEREHGIGAQLAPSSGQRNGQLAVFCIVAAALMANNLGATRCSTRLRRYATLLLQSKNIIEKAQKAQP